MYRLETDGWRRFRPDDAALSDRGLWLGDGVFETLRIDTGAIHNSQLHGESLEAGCLALDLACPDWCDVERGVADRAGPGFRIGKVIVTRGPAPRGLGPIDTPDAQVFLQLSDGPAPMHRIRLARVALQRSPSSLAARFKTLSYADNLAARRLANAAGGDMALLTTTQGSLSGGDSANLFWVADGRVFTPSTACGIRDGVMRRRVLDWLAGERVPVAEVEVPPEQLDGAQAVFMTNAVMGVVAVSEIDGRELRSDHPLLARLVSAGL